MQILRKDPRSPVFAALSEAYRKGGLLDEAIAVASEGLKYNPNYISGRAALGRAYYDKGEFDRAIEEMQKVVKSTPDNIIAHKLIADIYIKKSDAGGAIKELKTVIYLSPNDKDAASLLAGLTGPPAGQAAPAQEAPQHAEEPPKPVPELPLPPSLDTRPSVTQPAQADVSAQAGAADTQQIVQQREERSEQQPQAYDHVAQADAGEQQQTEEAGPQKGEAFLQGRIERSEQPAAGTAVSGEQPQSGNEVPGEARADDTISGAASIDIELEAELDMPLTGKTHAPAQPGLAPEMPEGTSESTPGDKAGKIPVQSVEQEHAQPDDSVGMRKDDAGTDEIEAVFGDLAKTEALPSEGPAGPVEMAVQAGPEPPQVRNVETRDTVAVQEPGPEADGPARQDVQGIEAVPAVEDAVSTEGGPVVQGPAPADTDSEGARPGTPEEGAASGPGPRAGEEEAVQPTGPQGEDIQTITMADLYVKQGHLDKAYQMYKKILLKSPDSPVVRTKFIKVKKLMESKEPEELSAEFEKEKIIALKRQEPGPPKMEGTDAVKENMKRLNAWLDKIKKGG